MAASSTRWPLLPLAAWRDTRDTLHMWTQVVGKVKLALAPPLNHWWQVALHVSPRGLTTGSIPWDRGLFEMTFDFVEHHLVIDTSEGTVLRLPLRPQTVAGFYREVMDALRGVGIGVKIWPVPVEVEHPIPFEADEVHRSYDREYAHRFWQVLASAQTVLEEFRAAFIGKSSPVHFFWGSFDLAVTRFSGRRAPERPGADPITREAYSHEVSSAGFWPGGGRIDDAAFYAYTVPEPPGLSTARVLPAKAFYSTALSEFVLMYDDVRTAAAPEPALLEFLQSTYEAGATLGNWNRAELERPMTTLLGSKGAGHVLP
jgi:hypothetical protein